MDLLEIKNNISFTKEVIDKDYIWKSFIKKISNWVFMPIAMCLSLGLTFGWCENGNDFDLKVVKWKLPFWKNKVNKFENSKFKVSIKRIKDNTFSVNICNKELDECEYKVIYPRNINQYR